VNQGDKLDELSQVFNDTMTNGEVVIPVVVAADASGGQDVTIPFAMQITGFDVVATAAAATSTLQLRKLTNTVSDAVAAATADTLSSAAVDTQAYATAAANDVYNVLAAGTNAASVRAVAYIKGYRL